MESTLFNNSSWVIPPRESHNSRLRLFCFPHAGGGPSFFSRWNSFFDSDIDVYKIALPGRETRRKESSITKMSELVDKLFQEMSPWMDQPFAMFGHSMGAAVAFEIAKRCEAKGIDTLKHLFISGRRAPHLPTRRRSFENLSDDEFLTVLQSLNGTPMSIMREEGMLEFFLPSLRADFELIETYVPLPGKLLNCPISAYSGDMDPEVDCSELSAWRHITSGEFSSRMMSGDHFYLQDTIAELTNDIQQKLNQSPNFAGHC